MMENLDLAKEHLFVLFKLNFKMKWLDIFITRTCENSHLHILQSLGLDKKLGRWPWWPFHNRLCLWNKVLLITAGAWISAGVTLKVGSSQRADRGHSRQCLWFCETCQRVLWWLQRGVFCINYMAILPLTKGLFKMQSWTSQTQSKLQQSEAEHFKSSFSVLLWMFNSLTHPTGQMDK